MTGAQLHGVIGRRLVAPITTTDRPTAPYWHPLHVGVQAVRLHLTHNIYGCNVDGGHCILWIGDAGGCAGTVVDQLLGSLTMIWWLAPPWGPTAHVARHAGSFHVVAAIQWTDIATAVANCVAAAGVLGVIWGAIWAGRQAHWAGQQVKEAERSRRASAVIDMTARWESQPMLDARLATNQAGNALQQKYLDARDQETMDYYVLQRIPNFFEDLAIRKELEGIDLEAIRRTLGSSVVRYWKRWKPIAKEIRRLDQNTAWENFEQLANQLQTLVDDRL